MEFELFTVALKEDGTVKVLFNPQLLQVATEEELLSTMADKMDGLIPIAENIIDFVSHNINSGMPLPVLQHIMGHETPATTQIYAQLNDETIKYEYRRIS